MSKSCPKCGKRFPEDDKHFCDQCGAALVAEPSMAGMGINLGDANAISGGLNLHDSHNVSTVNTVTNNITNIAPQKSDIDILQDKQNFFLAECKRAYEDGILEPGEEVALEECRIKLGLDEATSKRILETVRLLADRNNRKTSLNPIAKTKLKILSDNLCNNNVPALKEQLGNMEAIVNKYEHDELSRKYFLALAVLNPKRSIELKEESATDSYWKSYWCYLAYIKENETKKAEELLAGLDRFADYPEDNLTILATAGALMAGNMDEAKEYLDAVTGDYTPELQRFVDSVYLALAPETAKEMGADPFACSFYLVNMFGKKDPKVAAAEEAERKAREEAELKAKEEAERQAREEAERKAREEAERKAREEAERKAREEAERKAKEEAERQAREEAERKAREEAERKAREEAERKAREEAERKAKEEAERKAREEEERKAKEEAERKTREEAERKERESAERKMQEVNMPCVDLGLSVKWAGCNLGASAPEEFGDYFAWGEIEKHDFTDDREYKFHVKGSGLTKYNTKESFGEMVDNIKQLEPWDDAAHQILGGGWRMPTIKEFEELRLKCKVTKTSINGVPGKKYTSKVKGYTDKWIFLPGAGEWNGDKQFWKGSCRYWTSTLYSRRPDCAMMLLDSVGEDKTYRNDCLSIRPVKK